MTTVMPPNHGHAVAEAPRTEPSPAVCYLATCPSACYTMQRMLDRPAA